MQTRSLRSYLGKVEEKLEELEPLISSSQIIIEQRSPSRAVLKGKIMFIDGSFLHFLEYVLEEDDRLLRVSYRFHYVKEDGSLFLDMIMLHTTLNSQDFHIINTCLRQSRLLEGEKPN